jgi:glycosyltransferase involved in cell wall biosynthesis
MWWGGQSFGGLDRVFESLVNHLPACGVEVRPIVEGPADANARTNGYVQVFSRKSRWTPFRLLDLRRSVGEILRHDMPDIIAIHFALYAFVLLDRLPPGRFVMHFHGPWAAEALAEGQGWLRLWAKRRLEAMVYRRADRVIVLSEAFKALICSEYGVDAHRVRVIPGPVDVSRFSTSITRADARARLGLSSDGPLFVTVRRLTHRMGLDRLIAAMADIHRHYPQARLAIAGKGELRTNLEAQVAAAGLADNISFLGFVSEDDLPLLYRAADINVVPTVALEGFGLVAAEALCAGTPSLVTPIGGLPDVVQGLSNHLVFEGVDAASISSRLIAVLAGKCHLPDEEACRRYAIENFSASNIAAKTASVYLELVLREESTSI